jgi:osmotically-inducible protein OsmY
MKPPRNLGTFEERLKQQVCHQLLRNNKIDSNDIEVIVQHDTVTLKGSVPTEEARLHAEELTRTVPGVGVIRNDLAVLAPIR